MLALVGVAAIATILVFRMERLPQDDAYHRFADDRILLSVPNLFNVASNLPFLAIGLAGLVRLRRRPEVEERSAWFLLFLGMTLTAFGSAYYHWSPSNHTLVWDRLPMTVAFAGLFAALLGERVGNRAYRLTLWPLLALSVGSVIFWYLGELRGAGDLRLYALVQFLPILLIPLLVALYPPKYTHGAYLFIALGWYAAAKVFEALDRQIYDLSGFVSGHTLKHLAAALSCWMLLRLFTVRTRAQGASQSPRVSQVSSTR